MRVYKEETGFIFTVCSFRYSCVRSLRNGIRGSCIERTLGWRGGLLRTTFLSSFLPSATEERAPRNMHGDGVAEDGHKLIENRRALFRVS